MESARGRRVGPTGKKIREVGSRTWNALYQGNPSPPRAASSSASGGSLRPAAVGRTRRRHPGRHHDVRRADASWDMTFKDTKGTDFVVGQVWMRRGADAYLLDQVRAAWTSSRRAARSGSSRPAGRRRAEAGRGQGQRPRRDLLAARTPCPGSSRRSRTASKEARAAAVSPLVEAGNVWLPAPELAPWVGDFIEECAGFPTATARRPGRRHVPGAEPAVLQPLLGDGLKSSPRSTTSSTPAATTAPPSDPEPARGGDPADARQPPHREVPPLAEALAMTRHASSPRTRDALSWSRSPTPTSRRCTARTSAGASIGDESSRFTREGRKRIAALADLSATGNALIKRGVALRIAYVWGQGVDVTIRDDGSDRPGRQRRVAAVLGRQVEPPRVHLQRGAGPLRAEARDRRRGVLGAPDRPADRPGPDPPHPRPTEIVDRICDPEDEGTVWLYKRVWTAVTVDPRPVSAAPRTARRTTPSSGSTRPSRPKTYGGNPRSGGTPRCGR
jgi:predicted phage terminase large subunit-like protein